MTPQNLCTDPECLLRDTRLGSEFFADLVVRVLAGEAMPERLSEGPRLSRRPECVRCAQRVMRDLPPLPTVEERTEQVRQGRRYHRRWRRYAESGVAHDRSDLPFR